MKTEEFNLSDKIIRDIVRDWDLIKVKDVKEFIRRLKNWINKRHVHEFGRDGEECDKDCWGKIFPKEIDKLAGERLT